MASWQFSWLSDTGLVNYEPKENAILSDALARGESSTEFTAANRMVYVVDFLKKTQTQKSNTRRYRQIQYQPLHNDSQHSTTSSFGSHPSKTPNPATIGPPDENITRTYHYFR